MKKLRRKMLLAGAGAGSVIAAGSVAFAVDTESTVSKLLGLIVTLFQYVGFVLLAWGIGQFVISLKNDDADSKVKAIWLIIAAAALIAFKVIFEAVVPTNEISVDTNVAI